MMYWLVAAAVVAAVAYVFAAVEAFRELRCCLSRRVVYRVRPAQLTGAGTRRR